MDKAEAAFTHISAYGDWNHDWLALAYPSQWGVLALDASFTQLAPFPYYDANGNEAGTIEAGNEVLGLSWSDPVGQSGFSTGATLRVFSSNLAGFSNRGWGGDLGLRWQTADHFFSAGLALKNLGDQSAYYIEHEDLPSSLDAGISLRHPAEDLGVAGFADTRLYRDPARLPEVKFGVRVSILKRLELSAGWRTQERRQFTHFGGSLDLGWGKISYAYSPDALLLGSHALTLQFQNIPLSRK